MLQEASFPNTSSSKQKYKWDQFEYIMQIFRLRISEESGQMHHKSLA